MLQTGKFITRSDGKLTLDATNVKAERWEGDVQDLELISRQDVTKYKSEHAQVGGSVSVTYGSGGGANFNAAYNSAKLNTAQVENQTGIAIGKGGMDVTVKGNTHLEGAIISSQADKTNNRFQTGTLTTKDIQNHSELKTKSAAISGGSGGINPMSALSLLGNKNESSQSTTHSAIGESIDITLTEDPNAEITLKHLNRDTENANQKVTKQDLTKVKETQELVKGIGEIADKAMQIYTHSKREEIEQAKLALGKAKAANATKEKVNELTQQLNDLQKAYDKEYGTGSTTKRAVDAVTAALQGLAVKDAGQAIAGLASPYLNEQIKRHTENADGSVNKEANLLAHALLGAVEATITGNNALAGAAAGAGGEAAAMFITNTLYPNKKPNELTEAEKKNITFLSQLAGGLASGLVGDSTQAVALGGDIAKRAVENNFLSQKEWEELERLSKKKVLTYNEALRVVYLTKKDVNSDKLLSQYQAQFNGGKALSDIETATLLKWVAEYGSIDDQKVLLHTPVNAPQIRPDYSDLITKSKKIVSYGNTFESRQAESLKVGLETVAGLGVNNAIINTTGKLGTAILNSDKVAKITHSALVVNSGLNNAGKALVNVAQRYPLTTELSVTGIVNTGYQLSQDRPYNPYDLLQAGFSTALTRNKSLDKQLSINVMLSTLNTENSSDYGWNSLGATVGTIGANRVSSIKLHNQYGNLIIKPFLSGFGGEYLGDPNRYKENIGVLRDQIKSIEVKNEK